MRAPGPTVPGMDLSIGAVAEALDVSVDTLRYYEKARLADPPARDLGGRRRYTDQDVAWLRFLVRMRTTGMPIALLQAYAAGRREGPNGARRRREILEQHRADVVARLHELSECLALIDRKIENYSAVEAGLASTLPTARLPSEEVPA